MFIPYLAWLNELGSWIT